jgi:hypothetical protein
MNSPVSVCHENVKGNKVFRGYAGTVSPAANFDDTLELRRGEATQENAMLASQVARSDAQVDPPRRKAGALGPHFYL